LVRRLGTVRVTSAGITVLGRAFISFLAYTIWLGLSRDKVSFVGSDAPSSSYDIAGASPSRQVLCHGRPGHAEARAGRPRYISEASIFHFKSRGFLQVEQAV
jgi:hypothetical protein